MRWADVDTRKFSWHRWFAWKPVLTDNGIWVWWEYVDRILVHGTLRDYWVYRLPESDKSESAEPVVEELINDRRERINGEKEEGH